MLGWCRQNKRLWLWDERALPCWLGCPAGWGAGGARCPPSSHGASLKSWSMHRHTSHLKDCCTQACLSSSRANVTCSATRAPSGVPGVKARCCIHCSPVPLFTSATQSDQVRRPVTPKSKRSAGSASADAPSLAACTDSGTLERERGLSGESGEATALGVGPPAKLPSARAPCMSNSMHGAGFSTKWFSLPLECEYAVWCAKSSGGDVASTDTPWAGSQAVGNAPEASMPGWMMVPLHGFVVSQCRTHPQAVQATTCSPATANCVIAGQQAPLP